MTERAKQIMIDHCDSIANKVERDTDIYFECAIAGYKQGYSTAMSEAQGLIDALEYVQSGLLFSDLDTKARSNALDKIDHAIKQFKGEL